MNQTPVANRLHIGIFGRRNVGKSSFINALTNQELAIVSEVAGTTTDPVYKTIEILPEPGPCVIIDTAGLDDEGDLGELRKKKAVAVLDKTDLALVIIDSIELITEFDRKLIEMIKEKDIPIVIVINKIDLLSTHSFDLKIDFPVYPVSSVTKEGIDYLRSQLNQHAPSKIEDMVILRGLIKPHDEVILVIPIDSAMPKGRLILPEVQTLRSVLDENAHAIVCKEHELSLVLEKSKPNLVVTDSQVYHIVKDIVPDHIRLTSFSMLYARYKGDFKIFAQGAQSVDNLRKNDKILIVEACTHHPQPQDIGRFKIPTRLEELVGGHLEFEHMSGSGFPDDLSPYQLIIMCGSCMINRTQVMARIRKSQAVGIPVTNYGILFAKLSGILDRTMWLATA